MHTRMYCQWTRQGCSGIKVTSSGVLLRFVKGPIATLHDFQFVMLYFQLSDLQTSSEGSRADRRAMSHCPPIWKFSDLSHGSCDQLPRPALLMSHAISLQ